MAAKATPYNEKSTATQVASDLSSSISNKVVLTTGVSPNGLGAFFVQTIAKHNPRLVILAGRSKAKLQATADIIRSEPASVNVPTRLLVLDLMSQTQIREAAEEVLAYEEPIDVLVNSAGIMAVPYAKTEDGIESTFGSNHIGHFLFTNLIMPKLLASESPRVVNVSSDGHRLGPVRFDDWNFQDGKVYDTWRAYGQSKAANIIFSKALAEKLGPKGLKAYSLHPGVIFGTSLSPHVTQEVFADLKRIDKEMGSPLGEEGVELPQKNVNQGAATHVVAAFDKRIDGYNGGYLEDGDVRPDQLRPTATNPEDPEKLWKLSEQLVGQKFGY